MFVQIDINGLISLGLESSLESRGIVFGNSSQPLIVPLTLEDSPVISSNILYYRVTEDVNTLGQLVDMMTEEYPDLSEFDPQLAVITTWFINDLDPVCMQAKVFCT